MIKNELKHLVENNAVAFATVDENGNPHCIAVGDVKVISDKELLIGDNYMTQTLANIDNNHNVALCVWSRNWEDDCMGYELLGTVQYFTSGEYMDKIKEIHEGFPAKGAILFTVENIKRLA